MEWVSIWHKTRTTRVSGVIIRVCSVSFDLGFRFLLSPPASYSRELLRELLGEMADREKGEGIFEQPVLLNRHGCLVILFSARLLW